MSDERLSLPLDPLTSAVLALINAHDDNHARAERAFAALRAREAPLASTSFVLVETYALVG